MPRTQIVTLLTDFGTRDPYVAAMKGVILSQVPRAQIVDLSHEVPAHDVLAASMVLAQAAPWFPPGTVHVVVVDPGVGTDRRILAGQFGQHTYLFPDNGVITMIAAHQPLRSLVTVRTVAPSPADTPSMTFHGRDIFAPAAARLLEGEPLHKLGPQPQTHRLLDLPQPRDADGALVGEVIYVDHFGNLVTNIASGTIEKRWPFLHRLSVYCQGRDIGPLQGTYGFAGEGELLALFNSMGLLEIAVNQGRASDELGADVGTEVRVVGPLSR